VSGGPAPWTGPESLPVQELRRGYHDRLYELREHSIAVVRGAAGAVEVATAALLECDDALAETIAVAASGTAGVVAEMDNSVFALLALQAPVARDLRLVLASRDVAQIGFLCMGLCRTLATKARAASSILSPHLRLLLERVGESTAVVLKVADTAWATLDRARADAVTIEAERSRGIQREFMTALLTLREVPVDAAVELGMASRAYERLTDHGLEIAAQVNFVARGTADP
jgi:phosphate transport system protein